MILQITDLFPCEKTHTKSSPLWCGDESKRLPRARFHVRNLVFDRANQRHTLLLASDVIRIGQKKKHWFIFGAIRLGESFDKSSIPNLLKPWIALLFLIVFWRSPKVFTISPRSLFKTNMAHQRRKLNLPESGTVAPLAPIYSYWLWPVLTMTWKDHPPGPFLMPGSRELCLMLYTMQMRRIFYKTTSAQWTFEAGRRSLGVLWPHN